MKLKPAAIEAGEKNKNFGKGYYLFLMVLLGMLSAFGPFLTDLYLPTLPSLARIFQTTSTQVQMGLSMSMAGLSVGQVFFGPLSDKYGRRPVLLASLILFCVSTVACIFSPDIVFFNICRLLQGLGGAGAIVLSRSVATDCYSGRELVKTLAIIGAINGIAPVTAPVIGGLVASSIGWKGIFEILLGIGAVLLILCLPLKESLDADKKFKGKLPQLFKGFVELLHKRKFNSYVLIYAFASGVLFSYISSASFIMQNNYGYSELVFSLFFGLNAIGIAIGSGLTLRFRNIGNASIFGAAGICLAVLLQFAGYFLSGSFIAYESTTFLMMFSVGFVFTSTSSIAMEAGREHTGAASAIFGAAGFLAGAVVSPLAGLGNIQTTTMFVILVSGILCLLFSILGKRNPAVS